jgi:hypothetical protein
MADNGHHPALDAIAPAPVTFHHAVTDFKRRLIESALCEVGGNRTRAARALGLQRTYLLRLMREFGVNVPRAAAPALAAGGRALAPAPAPARPAARVQVDTRSSRGLK